MNSRHEIRVCIMRCACILIARCSALYIASCDDVVDVDLVMTLDYFGLRTSLGLGPKLVNVRGVV